MNKLRGVAEVEGTPTEIRALLANIVGAENVWQEEPLAKYTSFRVGGPAEWLVRANDVDAVVNTVRAALAAGLPVRILGRGSNVLVADSGVAGVVILNRTSGYTLEETEEGFVLCAESGVSLPRLAGELAKRGAAGMEWGVGVPGTVGGAVVQNAGAWGWDTKARLLSAELLSPATGALSTVDAGQLGLRYRGSNILDLPPEGRPIVTRAWFRLERDDPARIAERNARNTAGRTATQPRAASGGSTFRNPPGDYAGRLIEAAGLKGHQHGGAGFSEQHANFIVNYGDATAADICALIEHAHARVKEQFGIELESEVEAVGFRGDEARYPTGEAAFEEGNDQAL